jgi:hypothetical protein
VQGSIRDLTGHYHHVAAVAKQLTLHWRVHEAVHGESESFSVHALSLFLRNWYAATHSPSPDGNWLHTKMHVIYGVSTLCH